MCKVYTDDIYGKDAYYRDQPGYSGKYFFSNYTEEDHKKFLEKKAKKADFEKEFPELKKNKNN
jgi:hypothetical protein